MKRALVLSLLLFLPVASFAADPFKQIVKAIESEYGVRHTGIPWFARVVMKPAMFGSGVSGLKVAEFERGAFRGEASQERVATVVERTVGPEWQRMVRVRSRAGNETTYIYVRPSGQRFTMLIVSVESSEAAVVQMTLNPKQAKKWMDDTDEMALAQVKHRTARNEPAEVAALVSSETPGGYQILVP